MKKERENSLNLRGEIKINEGKLQKSIRDLSQKSQTIDIERKSYDHELELMRKSSADAIKLYRDKAKQEKIEYETKLEKKLEKQKK